MSAALELVAVWTSRDGEDGAPGKRGGRSPTRSSFTTSSALRMSSSSSGCVNPLLASELGDDAARSLPCKWLSSRCRVRRFLVAHYIYVRRRCCTCRYAATGHPSLIFLSPRCDICCRFVIRVEHQRIDGRHVMRIECISGDVHECLCFCGLNTQAAAHRQRLFQWLKAAAVPPCRVG